MPSNHRFKRIGAAAMVLVAAMTMPAVAQRFTVMFGELPPEFVSSEVRDLNEQGQFVGYVTAPSIRSRGALWDSDGRLVRLPDLDPSRPHGLALGINNHSQIVGISSENVNPQLAVLWRTPSTIVEIELPETRGRAGSGINDDMLICGDYPVGWVDLRGFLWHKDGTVIELYPPIEFPSAVNNRGQVVGTGLWSGTAWLWDNGRLIELFGIDGHRPEAYDLNEHGHAVGTTIHPDNSRTPMLWRDGRAIDLGSLWPKDRTAEAYGINDHGEIVGPASNLDLWEFTSFIWRRNLMTDLYDLAPAWVRDEWGLSRGARAINNRGQIVINARRLDAQGQWGRVMRLDPVDEGLTLWAFEPGEVGRRNVVQVNHATPGGRVYLIWGTDRGEPRPIHQCPGAMIDIADARPAGFAVAGPDGRAFIPVHVPPQAQGRRFVLQAIDHATCEVSPPAWVQFQRE